MIEFQKYIISANNTIKDALVALNNLSDDVLTLFVVDTNNCMVGTLTDGDIRRILIEGYSLSDKIEVAMHKHFHYINEGDVDVAELKRMKTLHISLLPTLNAQKQIVGVINLKKRISILPIDVVLMAGGKGERLRPLTDTTPKPLLKVGDKSIIDYNVERLIAYGVEHISVTVNYLKEQIEEHFKGLRDGIQVRCVREPHFMGTIGSIQFVENFHNDVILLMNSDLFTNINYEDFYLDFIESGADMSVAAVPYSYSVPFGIFELNKNDVIGMKEKPTYHYYANAGIYIFKRKHLNLIPQNLFYNATDFMETLIANRFKVIRYPLTGYWIDIGKHEDYNKAKDIVKHL